MVVLFLAILSSTPLAAQFQTIPSPTNEELEDVYFLDATTGYIVGDSGVIMKSETGGLNWTIQYGNDTMRFNRVRFFDQDHGLAVGSDVMRTTDGGATWTELNLGNDFYTDLAVLGPETCLITGYPNSVLRSTDKGATFSTLVSVTPNQEFGLLSMVDSLVGYSCYHGGDHTNDVLKTTDGGVNWVLVENTGFVNNSVVEAFSFVSEGIGFQGGWYNSHLAMTTDSANSWSLAGASNWPEVIDFHIQADLPYAYYACGWHNMMMKSVDGGQNWFGLYTGQDTLSKFLGIYFIDAMTGWVVGDGGMILKTTTGGVVGVEEEVRRDLVKVFPNPARDQVSLEYASDLKIRAIDLYDTQGRLLRSFAPTYKKLSLEGIPAGMYFLDLHTDKGRNAIELLIE